MKFFITGTRRGLGKYLLQSYHCVNTLEESDLFINCKHNGFEQVELLYKAAELKKRIINIGSVASDWTKGKKSKFRYAIEKKTLRDVNDQLFFEGVETTILNLGYIDTESVSHIVQNKMSLEYIKELIDWVLAQEHRIKEITVIPKGTW